MLNQGSIQTKGAPTFDQTPKYGKPLNSNASIVLVSVFKYTFSEFIFFNTRASFSNVFESKKTLFSLKYFLFVLN